MWPCVNIFWRPIGTINKILTCNYHRGLAKLPNKISRTHTVIINYKNPNVFRDFTDKN